MDTLAISMHLLRSTHCNSLDGLDLVLWYLVSDDYTSDLAEAIVEILRNPGVALNKESEQKVLELLVIKKYLF